MATVGLVPLRVVRASWDTNPRTIPLSAPNLNPPLKKKALKKVLRPSTQTLQTPLAPKTTTTTTTANTISHTKVSISTSELLKRKPITPKQGKSDDSYLGYERWLLIPPKVEKPRSMYNAATLAYIGDCVYELYARRHFLFPPLSMDEYNDSVMAVVRCEAQDALLKQLLDENYLSKEERDILRWGKNIDSGKTRTTKRVGVAVYSRASSLEALVGYLYLTNVKRLEEIMLKLGFSTGASMEQILEERCHTGAMQICIEGAVAKYHPKIIGFELL